MQWLGLWAHNLLKEDVGSRKLLKELHAIVPKFTGVPNKGCLNAITTQASYKAYARGTPTTTNHIRVIMTPIRTRRQGSQ